MHRIILDYLKFQFKLNRYCRGHNQGQGHGVLQIEEYSVANEPVAHAAEIEISLAG